MKGDGKPVSFVEDCAVPLDDLADYTARLDRGLREARHARHLVRARLGRLPARAARAQSEAGKGRQGDARDRRGGLRDGARLQGLAFGRARRRHRALGIPRGDVRHAARRAPSRRSRTRFDPEGLFNPGKIVRAPRMDDRTLFASGRTIASMPFVPALDWSAFRRRRRLCRRRRDVQQQRRLPQARPAARCAPPIASPATSST